MRYEDDQVYVLVVDDDPEVTELIARVMINEGHQVVTASSAEEALERLPYYTFQVAFIDQNLPQMEGLVLGDYLHSNNPFMQVALVTGETDPALRRESAEAGLSLIEKPFEIGRLLDVVAHYRREADERREARRQARDPEFNPRFDLYLDDLPAYFSLPNPPDRLSDALVRRLKECLNNIRSVARYTERDRVAALAGLLAARVLGLSLPRRRDGSSLLDLYDRVMAEHGRRLEFQGRGKEDEDPGDDSGPGL